MLVLKTYAAQSSLEPVEGGLAYARISHDDPEMYGTNNYSEFGALEDSGWRDRHKAAAYADLLTLISCFER